MTYTVMGNTFTDDQVDDYFKNTTPEQIREDVKNVGMSDSAFTNLANQYLGEDYSVSQGGEWLSTEPVSTTDTTEPVSAMNTTQTLPSGDNIGDPSITGTGIYEGAGHNKYPIIGANANVDTILGDFGQYYTGDPQTWANLTDAEILGMIDAFDQAGIAQRTEWANDLNMPLHDLTSAINQLDTALALQSSVPPPTDDDTTPPTDDGTTPPTDDGTTPPTDDFTITYNGATYTINDNNELVDWNGNLTGFFYDPDTGEIINTNTGIPVGTVDDDGEATYINPDNKWYGNEITYNGTKYTVDKNGNIWGTPYKLNSDGEIVGINTGEVVGTLNKDTGVVTDNTTTPFAALIKSIDDLNDANTFDMTDFMDKYDEAITDYGTNVDDWVTQAQNTIKSQGRDAMEGVGQSVLNEMAAKNMLNSSVTGDALSKGMTDVATNIAQQTGEAALKGAELKAKIPELMSQALSTQAQTSAQALLPFQLMLDILKTDIYGS